MFFRKVNEIQMIKSIDFVRQEESRKQVGPRLDGIAGDGQSLP